MKRILLLSTTALLFAVGTAAAKPIAESPILTGKNTTHTLSAKASKGTFEELYLEVTDGGDGYSCDWAAWGEPMLSGPAGQKKLTELTWTSATVEWGKANIDKDSSGGSLAAEGRPFAWGIGVHAKSMIHYKIPKGYDTLTVIAAAEDGGTTQANKATSIQFRIYDAKPEAAHKQAESVWVPPEMFECPEGLEVTLWAASPLLQNPTNIDFDQYGRAWVAEGVNYRRHAKRDPAGDRITVIEDTDRDGKADKSWTFVQETDFISPLGIAVVGKDLYVSQPPHLYKYTDVDGDAKFDPAVDKKEIFLTGFNGKNHDHSLHSLTVGPDGWLYFNHGNMGAEVTDKNGRTFYLGSPYSMKHIAGKPSADGHVYIGGATYRVRPDGTDLEVIGHNYRNSYEQTVTSFGDVFQNDNDDPPACRVSFVMEKGNFGFASADGKRSWGADKRPGQTTQVAEWRQDDPGTIPAGDVYGGGSPTGVAFYENGGLGPKWEGLLLSCEAGRNVVFGYFPKAKGAGFELERFDFLNTNKDKKFVGSDFVGGRATDLAKKFRPSDVVVGPDGAIYVSDWFDPRVGGHQDLDDTTSGAIYRVAPKGFVSKPPKLDLTTPEGAIDALKNPAVNVRALGFYALKDMGARGLPAVSKLVNSASESLWLRARGVWLEPHLQPGKSAPAYTDAKSPLQLTGLRANVRAGLPLTAATLNAGAQSPQASVQRETFIFLRDLPVAEKLKVWDQHLDTTGPQYDRSMLEAIGIGAAGHEAELYAALKAKHPDPTAWPANMAALAWRLHPAESVPDLLQRATDETLDEVARKQATEALAFIPTAAAGEAMVTLALSGDAALAPTATWWVRHRSNNDWHKFGLTSRLPAAGGKAGPLPISSVPHTPIHKPEGFPTAAEVSKLKGHPKLGQKYFKKNGACITCHAIDGKGGPAVGPDLKGIGQRLGREALIDALINPSAGVAFGFDATELKLNKGGLVTGFLVQEGEVVQIRDLTGNTHSIPKGDIKSSRKLPHSVMPSAATVLQAEHIAHIAAYLESLK